MPSEPDRGGTMVEAEFEIHSSVCGSSVALYTPCRATAGYIAC